ncbi:MAG: helix-turn-helix domain-containing protein [bacterium]|nr:helix-turn-helix domain-containing protein [bacterium]
MAENSTTAFGRYLRILRERKGLSLEDVSTLSATFPEKINKGYLSRVENGHQKVAFVKVVPLSRIYEVSADVLLERLELDMELDRLGGPDTSGGTYAELTELGNQAIQHGRHWDAYGYLRDAVLRAYLDEISSTFSSREEQVLVAQMNCGTASGGLGRFQFPLHELRHIESANSLTPMFHVLLLERLSNCYRAERDFVRSETYASAAIKEAESLDGCKFLGFVYANRARLAAEMKEPEVAVEYEQNAYRVFRDTNRPFECLRTLTNLSQSYFDLQRFQSARRACEGGLRLAIELGRDKTVALAHIMLGEIDELENKPELAIQRWKKAVAIAKALHDKELRFKAEFVLLRRALKDEDRAVVRAIFRRLNKLAPSIGEEVIELREFKRLEIAT